MRFILALLAFCLVAPAARAEKLESPDALEAALTKCLTTAAAPSTCFEKHLADRFPPGNEKLNEVVSQIAELFKTWLDKDKVFAVHLVKTTQAGKYAERRVYLIEDTTGGVSMLDLGFVRQLGSWYIRKFNFTTKGDGIKAVLGDVL